MRPYPWLETQGDIMIRIENNLIIHIPSRTEVQAIEVGQQALNCFGKWTRVTAISARREDINGQLFCCYSTYSGPGSSISMSVKEGELVRHVGMGAHYTSAELDHLEAEMGGQS